MKLSEKLRTSGFDFKKGLGQNYIFDEGFLGSVVKDIGLDRDDIVVEVGTGAGTLTRVIAGRVRSVRTFELDMRLEKILKEQFKGLENIELFFEDGLKSTNIPNEQYKVVANIPYYITTPLLVKFMRDPNCVEINVLVQQELGERMVAFSGTREYGALSIGVQAWGDAFILREVPRSMFKPQPNVDSVFVQIVKSDDNGIVDYGVLEWLVKGLFSSRRKTMLNGLSRVLNISKDEAKKILDKVGIDENFRPEEITVPKYIELTNLVSTKKYKI
ncbi:MAG: 16S rRNA (adenine(1518)-N(6)/adenine(1519)-N(6))-dimethyltransferase RsmA [Firmicutes bacterium]|nr:16S rRNA (adenine(1518)-N(6)/adenine(1519)-N(6))-dimethyltransferase RsmA [Bacillota bacterium]